MSQEYVNKITAQGSRRTRIRYDVLFSGYTKVNQVSQVA